MNRKYRDGFLLKKRMMAAIPAHIDKATNFCDHPVMIILPHNLFPMTIPEKT
jgi:hypothetical protein